MYELSERELYEAIDYAKSIDEQTGAKFIIEQFQFEQTALVQTIFGIFPTQLLSLKKILKCCT